MDATIKIAVVGILGRTAVITILMRHLAEPEGAWYATFLKVLGLMICLEIAKKAIDWLYTPR